VDASGRTLAVAELDKTVGSLVGDSLVVGSLAVGMTAVAVGMTAVVVVGRSLAVGRIEDS
jgi:hypothetical protein